MKTRDSLNKKLYMMLKILLNTAKPNWKKRRSWQMPMQKLELCYRRMKKKRQLWSKNLKMKMKVIRTQELRQLKQLKKSLIVKKQNNKF